MRILITGGSGFIGKNLKESLSGKHQVFAPSRQELDLLEGDQVRNYLRKQEFEAVIHGAVTPGHRNARDPSNQLYKNTRMFFHLMRSRESYGKLIFLSSGAVYDQRHYTPKMKEEYFDTHVPADEHGFSKYIAAKLIEQSRNTVELRLFGVFGKYEDYAIRFISNAICKSLMGLPITLMQNRYFDYLFIEDLVPVIEYFLENTGSHEAYNVTPDQAVALLALAQKVCATAGNSLPIQVAKDGFGPEYSGDNRRLRQEMPVLCFTPIDQAIRSLYDWYAEHKSLIQREILLVDR